MMSCDIGPTQEEIKKLIENVGKKRLLPEKSADELRVAVGELVRLLKMRRHRRECVEHYAKIIKYGPLLIESMEACRPILIREFEWALAPVRAAVERACEMKTKEPRARIYLDHFPFSEKEEFAVLRVLPVFQKFFGAASKSNEGSFVRFATAVFQMANERPLSGGAIRAAILTREIWLSDLGTPVTDAQKKRTLARLKRQK